MHGENKDTIGLILTGGGARGAYQVGVLKAISELSSSKSVAFPLISGVSVGALNAVGLASKSRSFTRSTDCLEAFWRSLRTENVFDVRFRRIASAGCKMVLSELLPFIFRTAPTSLLDTAPLRKSLAASIDLDAMSKAIDGKNAKDNQTARHPTLGDLGGYALDTLFHDSLDADIERLEAVNKTLKLIPAKDKAGLPLSEIQTLTINPSKDLQKIALAHTRQMPLSTIASTPKISGR